MKDKGGDLGDAVGGGSHRRRKVSHEAVVVWLLSPESHTPPSRGEDNVCTLRTC